MISCVESKGYGTGVNVSWGVEGLAECLTLSCLLLVGRFDAPQGFPQSISKYAYCLFPTPLSPTEAFLRYNIFLFPSPTLPTAFSPPQARQSIYLREPKSHQRQCSACKQFAKRPDSEPKALKLALGRARTRTRAEASLTTRGWNASWGSLGGGREARGFLKRACAMLGMGIAWVVTLTVARQVFGGRGDRRTGVDEKGTRLERVREGRGECAVQCRHGKGGIAMRRSFSLTTG